MGKIIGICGLIGSGKGTVADMLIKDYGFTKLSFADKLKDTVATTFDWPRDLLEGDTKESREWREQPDAFWTEELGEEITPRLALQLVGTDCMRKGFNDNIWMLIVKSIILKNPDTNYVIPDARFANERSLITDLGGEVWQVARGAPPTWYPDALSDNVYGTDKMAAHDIHASEWKWIDFDSKFANSINNNGTLEDLKINIEAYMYAQKTPLIEIETELVGNPDETVGLAGTFDEWVESLEKADKQNKMFEKNMSPVDFEGKTMIIFHDDIVFLTKQEIANTAGLMIAPVALKNGKAIAAQTSKHDTIDFDFIKDKYLMSVTRCSHPGQDTYYRIRVGEYMD